MPLSAPNIRIWGGEGFRCHLHPSDLYFLPGCRRDGALARRCRPSNARCGPVCPRHGNAPLKTEDRRHSTSRLARGLRIALRQQGSPHSSLVSKQVTGVALRREQWRDQRVGIRGISASGTHFLVGFSLPNGQPAQVSWKNVQEIVQHPCKTKTYNSPNRREIARRAAQRFGHLTQSNL